MMLQYLTYIIFSSIILYKYRKNTALKRNIQQSKFYVWLLSLLTAVSLIWIVYLLHNVFNLFGNIIAPALYSFLVYLILYVFFI